MGQSTSTGSLKQMRDSLKLEMERLRKLPPGCTEFEIHDTPEWADSILSSVTYYRNCEWSGTYIVINADSTFLYKHNGEGGANYLQMGTWKIKNDTIIVLTGNDNVTNEFIRKMKKFEDTKYRSTGIFFREYIRKQNLLLKYEHLETESN